LIPNWTLSDSAYPMATEVLSCRLANSWAWARLA
jgi:hypothetical protein